MGGDKRVKAEFLEALYLRTRTPDSWKPDGPDRLATRFDDLRIALDRTELPEFVSFTVWVHGQEGLIDEICDLDLGGLRPGLVEFDSYWALMHRMYWSAPNHEIAEDPLSGALARLKAAPKPEG